MDQLQYLRKKGIAVKHDQFFPFNAMRWHTRCISCQGGRPSTGQPGYQTKTDQIKTARPDIRPARTEEVPHLRVLPSSPSSSMGLSDILKSTPGTRPESLSARYPYGYTGLQSLVPHTKIQSACSFCRKTCEIPDQVWRKQIVVKDRPAQGTKCAWRKAGYCENPQHRTGRSGSAGCRAMIRSEAP